ncbi:hypothetical protein D3C71_1759170 [compost metagenome]
MATEAGKADHLATPCLERKSMPAARRHGKNRLPGPARGRTREFLFANDIAHRLDKAAGRKLGCHSVSHHTAILHHHDAVGGGENFAENVRNQQNRTTFADEFADIGHQLCSKPGVQ